MTRSTVVDDTGVIEHGIEKTAGDMTYGTVFRSG